MPRDDASFKLNSELKAKQVLLSQLADMCEGDEDFLRDSIEGETNLLELIDKLDASIDDDEAVAAGADTIIKKYQARKKAAENRKEAKRSLILNALESASLTRHRTAAGVMLSVSANPISALILEESDIPSKYFAPVAPKLDKAALTKDVRARENAIAEASKIEDETARKEALAKVDVDFPAVAGVTASNGGNSLTRR